jgi:fatty-acid peroxygenase
MRRFDAPREGNGATMQNLPGDHTAALLREGYALMPELRRRAGGEDFRTRLLGMRVVCLCGPEAARRFYDQDLFARGKALPRPVQRTLTGTATVHSKDDEAFRERKGMFLAARDPGAVRTVVERTAEEWDAAAKRWSATGRIVLFDEAAEVLTRGVCEWAAVPLGDEHARAASADLTAMVDGWGSLGRRHWRARVARRRAELRLTDTVRRIRSGELPPPPPESMFERILQHREGNGDLLEPHLAAVETLNVLRPTVAISWFVAFAAHALHRWPEHRTRLRDDDAFAEAFAHEVRRFYPFAPFMGAHARRDIPWDGDTIGEGTLVLLDLFGQNHDERLWEQPYAFRPDRFLDRRAGQWELVPQGAGDPAEGHRCPGEDITVALLKALLPRLARMSYDVPEQDLSIPLGSMPTRPRSGVVLTDVRADG